MTRCLLEERTCAVVGMGSIGKRHFSILSEIFNETYAVSCSSSAKNIYRSPEKLFQHAQPSYIVVANETHKHLETLIQLKKLGYKGKILIEKPLFTQVSDILISDKENIFVGYNLRYSKIVEKIKITLKGKKIFSADFYAGQYLPDWRPGTDYSKSYSAHEKFGGGVTRDLSHEIDMCAYLCGDIYEVVGKKQNSNFLDITSEDVASFIIKTNKNTLCSVRMDYLNKIPTRKIMLNTEIGTINADLINHTFELNGDFHKLEETRDSTYRKMHLDILLNEGKNACTFKQGIDILEVIEQIT